MSRMTIILLLVGIMGCAASRPKVSVEIHSDHIKESPEYTIHIQF